MNQHKDLLYRQKYATYQLNNRTFSTQNTKISARSLAISYIYFQVRIVKKKKGGGEAILSTTTENLVTPAPPTPDKGSIREIATGEITLPITPDDHLEGPYLLKTRELPGAPSPGAPAGALPLDPTPPGALRRVPGPHPYEARAYAHGFFRPPLFCKSWIRHCTHPPLLVQVACPQRRRTWGSWGAVAPPPYENIGGGGKHIVLPPPPIISST